MKTCVYDSYMEIISSICNDDQLQLLRSLPSLPWDQRKEVLRLSRTLETVEIDTQLGKLLLRYLSFNTIQRIQNLFSTPLECSILQACVKCAPLTLSEKSTIEHSAANKEIDVMASYVDKIPLNYCELELGGSIFPLCNSKSPHNSKYIQRFYDWCEKVGKKILYPKVSRKRIARSTECELKERMIEPFDEERGYTQQDLELFLHRTGKELEGACEMKQRWYINQMEPRTYFTQGGTAYNKTKYSSKITNLLRDTLDSTNRHMCTVPNRLILEDNEYGFIYDLSSFTSNDHEQYRFLQYLASLSNGYYVTIMDGFKGEQEVPLSLILSNLADLHDKPLWEYNGSLKVRRGGVHNISGFLGVYGNIQTATYHHGLVALQGVSSEAKLNVAGDDAIAIQEMGSEPIRKCVEHIGILKDEKVFRTNESGCICLKKGIVQIGSRLLVNSTIKFPIPEYQYKTKDIDPRYPNIIKMSKRERKSAVSSQILAFISSLSHIVVRDYEVDKIMSFLHTYYRVFGLPIDGDVPQISGNKSSLVPCIRGWKIGIDVIQHTIRWNYVGTAKIPERTVENDEKIITSQGAIYKCTSGDRLKYLEILGYVKRKKLFKVVYDEHGLDELLKEYVSRGYPVYEFTNIKELPF